MKTIWNLKTENWNLKTGLCFDRGCLRYSFMAFFILFMLSACFPTQENVKQKLDHLKQANQEHNQNLSQELDGNSSDSKTTTYHVDTPKTKSKSSVTLAQGVESASFVNQLPAQCEQNLFCGLAFVDHCENANSCREEAETKARDDLRKRISVRIQSQSQSRTYSEMELGTEAQGHKTFESSIRERAVSIELKNVRFTHFYWIPQKQLQTLARMQRPQEQEPEKENQISKQPISDEWRPMLLVFLDDEKTPNLNIPEIQIHFQQRIIAALQAEKAVLLNDGQFQLWENESGIASQEKVEMALETAPESAILTFSLSGRIDPYEGRMAKSMMTVFLKVVVYGKAGSPIFRKSFQARRPLSKAPDKLTDVRKQELFLRTVEKGLSENEQTLLTELKKL